MLKGIVILVSLLMIKLKVSVLIPIWMVQFIMENGIMINNMEKEKKLGLKDLIMKENIKKVLSMEKDSFNGTMVLVTKDSFCTMKLKEKGFILGMMEESLMEIGKITKWMEKVFLLGLMEDLTSVAMLMIKSMVMGFLNGK